MVSLSEAPCAPALRSLALGSPEFENASFLSRFSSLESIKVKHGHMGHFMALCEALMQVPSLVRVSGEHLHSFGPNGLETALLNLSKSSVQTLELTNTEVHDVHIAALRDSSLTELNLDLQKFTLDGSGFANFSPHLRKLRLLRDGLKHYHLVSSPAHDVHFPGIPPSSSILHLFTPPLSDTGLACILALTHLTELNFDVVLTNTTRLDAISEMKQLQNLTIRVYESVESLLLPPTWLTRLPTSIETLSIILRNSFYRVEHNCSLFRSYTDTLPFLCHLTQLRHADFAMGGKITAKLVDRAAECFPSLQTLSCYFSPRLTEVGYEETTETLTSFANFQSLTRLELQTLYSFALEPFPRVLVSDDFLTKLAQTLRFTHVRKPSSCPIEREMSETIADIFIR